MYLGPLLLTFVVGTVLIALSFIPHHAAQELNAQILLWATIVYAFALILGSVSLMGTHWRKIRLRASGALYSWVAMATLVATTAMGVIWGVGEQSPLGRFYNAVNSPLASTMFALLAFFIASAAFRAFRARNTEAALLLGAAIIVLLGRAPIGTLINRNLPDITNWIIDWPNNAGRRAIIMGAALGAIVTGLRVLLGMERQHVGGE